MTELEQLQGAGERVGGKEGRSGRTAFYKHRLRKTGWKILKNKLCGRMGVVSQVREPRWRWWLLREPNDCQGLQS